MKRIALIMITFLSLLSLDNIQAQTLTKYAEEYKKELAERQRVEKQKYETACKNGTLEGFKEYLKLYPNGKYAIDVKNRIADFEFWSKASSANTLEAYNDYMRNSKYKSFLTQANEAITELNSKEEWKVAKNSDSISIIEGFISKYPKSTCILDARKRIHELKGINYYNSNDYLAAFSEFKEAGGKLALDSSNWSKYDICEEFYDYNKLGNYAKESELSEFLYKHPSSKYLNVVSNMLAIAKAKELTMFSGENTFKDALSYAKDESTRTIVRSYINNCKESYSQYKKQQRKAKIKSNGGYILFGLEGLDFGWNGISSDRMLDIGYYNIGISIKLGNFKSPVQFELGLKPGIIFYENIDDSYYDESENKFHLSIYTKLKINIYNVGHSSKLYIAGLGYYNTIKEDYLENDYSVGGGLGIAWKHWDWLTLYYKQDLDYQYKISNKYLGSSLVYYF